MELRRTLLTALALVAFNAAFSQNYKQLWDKATVAMEKDLPKTALKELRGIYSVASKHNNTGEMLKAAVCALQMQQDISPDSAKAEIKKIDSIAGNEKRPAERALWMLVAAKQHKDNADFRDSSEADKAADYLSEATKDLSIFNNRKAEEFVPAISKGSDSKYYNGDLLNVVCRNAIEIWGSVNSSSYSQKEIDQKRNELAGRFIDHYRKTGNANAVVLATLDSLEHSNTDFFSGKSNDTTNTSYIVARKLMEQYAQSPCAVEAYIYICNKMRNGKCETEDLRYNLAKKGAQLYSSNPRSAALRNIIKEAKTQNINANFEKSVAFPGEKLRGNIEADNIPNLEIQMYRLPYTTSQLTGNLSLIKKLKLNPKDKIVVYSKSITPDKEYYHFKDSFIYSAPAQPGLYLVKVVQEKANNQYSILKVSNVRALFFPLPDKRMRIAVVDARSGKPIAGAKVNELNSNSEKITANYTTDDKGEVIVARKTYAQYNAEYGNDKFCPFTNHYQYTNFSAKEEKENEQCRLYTDRAVYRPAQTVFVAGLIYSQKGDEFNTVYDKSVKLTLTDANNKTISSQEVKSDEFGSFGAEFTLPSTIVPGTFRIKSNQGTAAYIKVEEYKRPTFEVTTDKPNEKYALGDTLSLKGHATSYTGAGITGAKVSYEVKRRSFSWLIRKRENDVICSDTVTTDSNGDFVMRVPITANSTDVLSMSQTAYVFIVSASVTSGTGETQETELTLSAGKRSAFFNCNIPQIIEKGKIPTVTFKLQNILYEPTEGKGKYSVYNGSKLCAEGSFTSNEPTKINGLANLPSGKYVIHTQIEGENDSVYDVNKSFILFSVKDTQAADSTEHVRLYSPDEYFNNGKAVINIASSLNDVTAFYDVIANGKLVESKHLSLSNSAQNFTYDYKQEYGDGISVVLAFMKDGKLYNQNITIKKAVPEKTLKYKWTSFRNRLRPNEKEEWRLQLTNLDGTPVQVSSIAAVYDASLDKFAKNNWYSNLYLGRYVPTVSWNTSRGIMTLNYYNNPFKYENLEDLNFDEFSIFEHLQYLGSYGITRLGIESVDIKSNDEKVLYKAQMAKQATALAPALKNDLGETIVSTSDASAETSEDTKEIAVRENFAETAFFAPSLRSDENGNLTIAFTTPESLTRWNVKVLAHTKDMNIVEADTTATVVKEFMIQPNMPRFLRLGDNATIPATIKNLSEKSLSGKAVMTMQDAENLAIIKRETIRFSVDAKGETVIAFPFKAEESLTSPLLICKITADCGTFSDGEQHYLPLFSDKIEVISSLPFTIQGSGKHTVDIPDTLTGNKAGATNRKLTIEYTSNPTWLALQALPTIDNPKWEDALTIAAAYYAASLEHEIASVSPEIKAVAKRWANEQTADTLLENALLRNQDIKNILLTETPWAANADNVSLRRRSLAHTFNELESGARERNLEERLARLQREDGGFSWFPNMPSSYYITSGITTMLLRLNSIKSSSNTESIIRKAVDYLDKQVAEDIKEMKKISVKGNKLTIYDSHLDYLNILRMYAGKLSPLSSANRKYLLPILQKHYPNLNIEAKSKAALVLKTAGYDKEAMTTIKSILEHTVSDKDKGMYFDSFNALSYWNSYKIPAQVAALEAVRALTPDDKTTQNGMLTWILQSKRTQGWETALNTVDAVYALLTTTKSDDSLIHFNTAMPDNFTLNMKNGKTINVAENAQTADKDAVGYMRSDFSLDELKSSPKSVNISKTDGGISWGGIYSRYLAPAQNVENGGGELTVKREYFLVENGKETPVANGASINTGNRIRVRYTINSSRDFDYVSLTDPRPACLEPDVQTSGYTCNNGEWFYLAVRDASQALFFEKMEKGKHIVTLDFHADRKGTYLAAPASVQCLYSPEFSGRSNGRTINVKQNK